MTNEDDDIDPETQDLLTSDFEIGHYIRERIIPRAVLFFTGKKSYRKLDMSFAFTMILCCRCVNFEFWLKRHEFHISGEALEEDDDYDDEDEEGEEEEDEDEDTDPDFDPSKVKPGQNPQECKQQ